MLYELFRLGDGTVWLEDWEQYEDSFAEILEKYGYDLYLIYHGKTKEQLNEERDKRREKALREGDIGKAVPLKPNETEKPI